MSVVPVERAGGDRQPAIRQVVEGRPLVKDASSFDWAPLLVGQAVAEPKKRWLLTAHRAALQVARAFIRDGLGASLSALERVPVHRGAVKAMAALPDEARVFVAWEVAWQSRGVVRTLYGRRRCLCESLAATAALRALGLPASTVVGYATGFGSPDTPVHAWTALDDVAVSDRRYVWQAYTEISRYPRPGKDAPCAA